MRLEGPALETIKPDKFADSCYSPGAVQLSDAVSASGQRFRRRLVDGLLECRHPLPSDRTAALASDPDRGRHGGARRSRRDAVRRGRPLSQEAGLCAQNIALLSHSNFGSHDSRDALKKRQVREALLRCKPELNIDGEMQGDTAWDEALRKQIMPNSTLKGRANLFVLPNLEAANIAYNLVRVFTDGVAIGPILMGISKPVHILTTSVTSRRVMNMTAIAAVDAQIRRQRDAEKAAADKAGE